MEILIQNDENICDISVERFFDSWTTAARWDQNAYKVEYGEAPNPQGKHHDDFSVVGLWHRTFHPSNNPLHVVRVVKCYPFRLLIVRRVGWRRYDCLVAPWLSCSSRRSGIHGNLARLISYGVLLCVCWSLNYDRDQSECSQCFIHFSHCTFRIKRCWVIIQNWGTFMLFGVAVSLRHVVVHRFYRE